MTHQAFQEQPAAELIGVPLDFSVPEKVYAHVLYLWHLLLVKKQQKRQQKEGESVYCAQGAHSFHVQGLCGASVHEFGQDLS